MTSSALQPQTGPVARMDSSTFLMRGNVMISLSSLEERWVGGSTDTRLHPQMSARVPSRFHNFPRGHTDFQTLTCQRLWQTNVPRHVDIHIIVQHFLIKCIFDLQKHNMGMFLWLMGDSDSQIFPVKNYKLMSWTPGSVSFWCLCPSSSTHMYVW